MRTWITKTLCSLGVGVLCTQLQAQTLNEAKQLYNEGLARARARTLRRRHGDGRGVLRLGGFQEGA